MMGDVSGVRVLDLGCGAGHYTRLALEHGAQHVVSVDFAEKMISQLPKDNVTGVVADAGRFRADEKFSRIICAGLIEFVDDPVRILRCARENATAQANMVCLLPPANWGGNLYRAFHSRNGLGIRLYTNGEWKNIAERGGWAIKDYVTVYPYSTVYRLSRLD